MRHERNRRFRRQVLAEQKKKLSGPTAELLGILLNPRAFSKPTIDKLLSDPTRLSEAFDALGPFCGR